MIPRTIKGEKNIKTQTSIVTRLGKEANRNLDIQENDKSCNNSLNCREGEGKIKQFFTKLWDCMKKWIRVNIVGKSSAIQQTITQSIPGLIGQALAAVVGIIITLIDLMTRPKAVKPEATAETEHEEPQGVVAERLRKIEVTPVQPQASMHQDLIEASRDVEASQSTALVL